MTELTAELIADIAVPWDLEVSPDGRSVAYQLRPLSRREDHASSAIWVVPAEGGEPVQLTAGRAHDVRPRWSPDGRRLAFLSDRRRRGVAELHVIAVDGGEARAVLPSAPERTVLAFAWAPDGAAIACVSADEPTDEDRRRERERDDARVHGERPRLGRLRVVSVATGEVTTLVATDRHVADLAWRPDGAELAFVTWETPDLESTAREAVVATVPAAGGEPHEVCRALRPSGLAWAGDATTLLFTAPASGRSQSSRAVFAVPAGGGTPRRVTGGETNCALDLYGLAEPGAAAVWIAEGLASRLSRIDVATGAELPLSVVTEEEGATITSAHVRAAAGGHVVAMTRAEPRRPPEVWSGRAGSPRQVSRHQEALAGVDWAPIEPFRWMAPDGLVLDGLLVLPPGERPRRPLPTVVLVHGGPYWRWTPGALVAWANWSQWLAMAGCAVLLPNIRGGMGHGEAFAAAAVGDVGGADYHDVMAAVDAAVERGIADPDRLGIGGWSQGGFMTAWAVTQTKRFRAGVIGAGVTDWGMMVLTSDVPGFEAELGGSRPWDGVGPLRHQELSPISFAADVRTPVLFLHGERDARVPVSQAIGFHRALRDHGARAELVIYPREGHAIEERAHQLDLLRRVRAWFAEHLPVG